MIWDSFTGLVFAAIVMMGSANNCERNSGASPDGSEVVAVAQAPSPKADDAKPASTTSQKFTAILAEYEAALSTARVGAEKAKTDFESSKIYGKLMPDVATYSRRMVDLAATDPKDTAARDALLWVVDQPGMSGAGPYSDELARAVLMLLRYHADDPDVARVGLGLDNIALNARDIFLEGLYIRTKGREAKGLARVALAQYLEMKARYAGGVKIAKGPASTKRKFQTFDDSGKLVEKEFEIPPEDLAYHRELRMTDPEAIRSEAKRLFEEVIKDYGDIPYVSRRLRKLQELMKQPEPTIEGKPLTPQERKQLEQIIARKKTLADAARARLDEMENLVAGKPAPAISGKGMDGKPRKLADYHGKIVVLVFWGTWCGPCMQQVPHERELVKRYKDKPFAMLGVDCDADSAAAIKVMKDEGITWPNWNDGEPGEGPIAKTYHVRGYPSTFVIDAQGIIRHIGPVGSGLDKVVDDLIRELETGSAGK